MAELNDAVAQLRREFCAGLPQRLDRLDFALTALRRAPSPEMIEIVHLQSHSLKGTALAYGAEEVARHAAVLSGRASGWLDGAPPLTADLTVATEQLELLKQAVDRYRQGIGSETAS